MAEAAAARPASPRTHLYGGQAVVEGVMMRGAGFWAIAVRRPDGTIHVESHEIDSIVLRVPAVGQAVLPRDHRARPVARDRHARVDGLREPIAGGRGAADPAAGRPVGRAGARAVRRHLHHRSDDAVRVVREPHGQRRHPHPGGRGRLPRGDLRGVPLADRQDEGHPPRLRVPRCRAQDDRRLRTRRGARARVDRPVPQGARPVRHELPDHRDDHHDLRVHAVRHAGAAVADPLPRDRDPDHRRDLLRGAAARCEASRVAR